MSFIIVYITHATEKVAMKVSNYLVEQKFAACANIFPIKSTYWWNQTVQTENEWVSIVKTIPENWIRLKKEVEKVHPYEVPCIMKFDVEANEAYENWIRESVELKS